MKANILFVSMIALLTVLTGAIILSGCGNPTGGGGSTGGGSLYAHYIWVSNSGSDETGTGTNAANAYKTINYALSVAKPKTLIRVVDGTYAEHLSWSTFESVCISGESTDGAIISGDATGICITIPSDAATNQTIIIQSLTINNGSSTGSGGGIYIHQNGITVNLKNVVMANNNSAGGGVNGGGAIYGAYQDDNVLAENCTFEGNTGQYGGAVLLVHGLTPPSGGYLSASNCNFSNNSAAQVGGAIYVPNITLEACSLSGNQVTRAGYADSGAAYVSYGGTMTNCLFFNNKVDTGVSQGLGGAIRQPNNGFDLKIFNCTFASNEVISSNVASGSGAIDGYSQTKLTNCILYGNIALTDPQIIAGCNVNYSDVQGGYPGTNNVDFDPAFAATSLPYSSSRDLMLTASTTTDVTHGGTKSGAPSKDYAGTARSGHNSMGAYQYP